MATTRTRAVVRNALRVSLGDWPREKSALNGALNPTQTTVAVTTGDGSKFVQGDTIEIDDEAMLVKSVATDTLTVVRGHMATSAVAHGDQTLIEVPENLTNHEINEWINRCIEESYPEMYKIVEDTSITYVKDTRVYTLPTNADPTNITALKKETYAGSGFYIDETKYEALTGNIHLNYSPAEGNKTKLYYMQQMDLPSSDTATTAFPQEIFDAYVAYRDLDDELRKRAKAEQYTARLDRDAANIYELLNIKRERYSEYRKKLVKAAMPQPAFKIPAPKR